MQGSSIKYGCRFLRTRQGMRRKHVTTNLRRWVALRRPASRLNILLFTGICLCRRSSDFLQIASRLTGLRCAVVSKSAIGVFRSMLHIVKWGMQEVWLQSGGIGSLECQSFELFEACPMSCNGDGSILEMTGFGAVLHLVKTTLAQFRWTSAGRPG